MAKRTRGPVTVRRFRRPRCLKGQKHMWLLGAATIANPSGHLTGQGRCHLRGRCHKCGKAKAFHPFAAVRVAA